MRGQTTMDYAIGISLFLLVLVGVFAFLPSVFAPFSADGGAALVVADRSASTLVGTTLAASADRPNVLDAACTREFFDVDGDVPADCDYDAEADALHDVLGVDDARALNVTVRNATAVTHGAGPPVPTGGDVVTATRVVLLDGDQQRLRVAVW